LEKWRPYPYPSGVSVELYVINAVRQIGVMLDRAEIDAIHRLPTKVPNRQRSIILELKSRKTRDFILSKRYSAVIKAGNGQRVFINGSLSPYFKDLLRKAKDCAMKIQKLTVATNSLLPWPK